MWRLVRMVEKFVPGLVENSSHSEDDEAEGEETSVQPVEQDQG